MKLFISFRERKYIEMFSINAMTKYPSMYLRAQYTNTSQTPQTTDRALTKPYGIAKY